MAKEEIKKEEFVFKKSKKSFLKYFLIGFLIATFVILLLSGIFILTLITVLR